MKQTQGIFFKDFKNAYIPEILKELYRDKVYDFYFKGKKDLTVIDAGANIGLFTYYAYPFVKKIYSLEPSMDHFDSLSTMVNFNHMDRVIPLKLAIGDKNEEATFYHNPNSTMYSLEKAVNALPKEAEKVKVVTLSTLFDKYDIKHVDFMKVDIEGSEMKLFASKGFAGVASKIDHIMIEYHTWSGINPNQLKACLIDNGFKFSWIDKTEATIALAERKI